MAVKLLTVGTASGHMIIKRPLSMSNSFTLYSAYLSANTELRRRVVVELDLRSVGERVRSEGQGLQRGQLGDHHLGKLVEAALAEGERGERGQVWE